MEIDEREKTRIQILKYCSSTIDNKKLETAIKDLSIEDLRNSWGKIKGLIASESSLQITEFYIVQPNPHLSIPDSELIISVQLSFPSMSLKKPFAKELL